MVDIHCHILPDLDDGPESLEESVGMVHMAAASGTTGIVATQHANLEYGFHSGVVDERISQLVAASGGAVRIRRGCDFHLYYKNVVLVDAYRHVSERYGETCAHLLFVANPLATLAGEPVEQCVATAGNRAKTWYRFW